MKIKKNVLTSLAQALLGATVAFVAVKLPEWKWQHDAKAYEDFKNFVNDKAYVRMNGGLKEKRIGPALVNIAPKKDAFVQYDFSKWKKNGDFIGLQLGDYIVEEEDNYVIPEIEVYIFKNGLITHRFHPENGIIDFNEGLIQYD